MILAIDTSAAQCAVALRGPGATAMSERRAMRRGHAEALFPMIGALLARAGAGYGDLARVAVCTGPGSFTGLRIGISAARGIALGCGVPAIGVDRFEALAAAAAPVAAGREIAVALAGREAAVLRLFDPVGAPLGAERRIAAEALAAQVPGALRVGDGWGGLAEAMGDGLADPGDVAALAAGRPPAAPPAPLYFRGADADPPRETPPRILDGADARPHRG